MKQIRAAKGYKHAKEFSWGEILESVDKKNTFSIKKKIGVGGFGLIYTARKVGCSPDEECVAKVEPIGNGPLFNEFHALQKIARPNIIQNYLKGKRLTHLAIPKFIANGVHEYKSVRYRFIIIPKYGKDLQTFFEENGSHLDEPTVYSIAIQMIDALEYIHHHGYVHADLKAGNILFAADSNKIDKVYLIDYGLASKVFLDNKHKPYKPEKKNAHNGTLLYTSLDAHDGAGPSRRGDLQILGFCMYEWLTGSLPWKKYAENKEQVKREKEVLLQNLSKIPFETLRTYFKTIEKLEYDDQPDYETLRRIFLDAKPLPVLNRRGGPPARKRKLTGSDSESQKPKAIKKQVTPLSIGNTSMPSLQKKKQSVKKSVMLPAGKRKQINSVKETHKPKAIKKKISSLPEINIVKKSVGLPASKRKQINSVKELHELKSKSNRDHYQKLIEERRRHQRENQKARRRNLTKQK